MVHPTSLVFPVITKEQSIKSDSINFPLNTVSSLFGFDPRNLDKDQEEQEEEKGERSEPFCCQTFISLHSAIIVKVERVKKWSERKYSSTSRVMGNVVSYAFAYCHRLWSGAFWVTGEWLDLHMAILNHDNKLLKELLILKYDPSSNCCSCLIDKFPSIVRCPEWKEYFPLSLEHIAPLHVAVLCNNLDAVKILLRPRPDCKQIKVDLVTKTGKLTALHFAIFMKNRDMIELLIRAGANISKTRSDVRTQSGSVVKLTPFELALERSEKIAELVYTEYENMNFRKRFGGSVLLEYLSSGHVNIHAVDTLIRMGENIDYETEGENGFMMLLKDYKSDNMIEVINYMLKHVNLKEQERMFRERNYSITPKCFPSLFVDRDQFRSSFGNHGHQLNRPSHVKKGYNSIGVVLKYCSRKEDRMALVKLLLHHGSSLRHLTRRGRSLLHLTIKSNYSCLAEVEYLVENKIPIQWTDIKQAIKYKKIRILHYLLTNSTPNQLNLCKNLPEAMSMLVFTTKPGDYPAKGATLTWFLKIFMSDHRLDPRPIIPEDKKRRNSVVYPMPLLFLLIFKNKLYRNAKDLNGLYEEAIKLIVSDERIDLDYRYGSHGTALNYATKLGQPHEVINLLFPVANDLQGMTTPIVDHHQVTNPFLDQTDCLACQGDGFRCPRHILPQHGTGDVVNAERFGMVPFGHVDVQPTEPGYLPMEIVPPRSRLRSD